jgi:hypothetical protein
LFACFIGHAQAAGNYRVSHRGGEQKTRSLSHAHASIPRLSKQGQRAPSVVLPGRCAAAHGCTATVRADRRRSNRGAPSRQGDTPAQAVQYRQSPGHPSPNARPSQPLRNRPPRLPPSNSQSRSPALAPAPARHRQNKRKTSEAPSQPPRPPL